MIPLLATASGLLLRGSLFRTVGLMAQLMVAFFLTPFIIEAIGQRYYGMWALIGTIVGYYGYLDFGLSKAVQYFIARAVGKADTIEMNRIVVTALTLFALLGVVALTASLVVASSAPWFLDDPVDVQRFRIVMLIMGANVLCAFPMMALNGLFSAHLRYDLISGLELAKFVLRSALIVYFLGQGYSIVALATIQTLVDFAGHLAKLLMARRLFADFTLMHLRPSKELLRPLFAYGGKAFTHSAADLLRFQVDDLVVVFFLNLSVVAVYTVAAQLVSYFRQLLGMIFGVIVPVYAQYSATNDTAKMKRAFVFSSRLAAALSVLLGGNAIVFGEPFIATWLGPSFAASYGVLVILILAAMVHVAQEPGLALIYGIARHGTYAKVAIVEGMINLGLSLILVGPYGLKGVALGTAIPMLLSAGYVVWYVTRYLEYRVVEHLKSIGGIGLLGAVCHVLTWQLVQHRHLEGFAAIFAHAAVILPMEGALLFLVGFTSSEREIIYRSLRMMTRSHAKVETGSRAL